MPEKGFTNFDGRSNDARPIERRQKIEKDGVPLDPFDETLLKNENGELDPELITVESYTLSGFIIEEMWKELQSKEGTASTPDSEKIPLDEHFWENFITKYCKLETPVQDNLKIKTLEAMRRPVEEWTDEDRILIRAFHIQELQSMKDFGRPSFKDFILIYTRLARVAEERFQEQMGRDINRTEYEHILSDKSFMNMMLQMMMNSRGSLTPVMAWLEGNADTVEFDPTKGWKTDRFLIEEMDGKPILQPNEKLLEKVRESIQSVMTQFKEQEKKHPQILRCPVLYTGLFSEMCDWLRKELEHHYLDQKYQEM